MLLFAIDPAAAVVIKQLHGELYVMLCMCSRVSTPVACRLFVA
jgi:hypothetical protein